MKRVALILLLLPSLALADPDPAAGSPPQARTGPARVCVPAALLDRLVGAVASRPWSEVAPLMDDMRAASRSLAPCTAGPDPAPR